MARIFPEYARIFYQCELGQLSLYEDIEKYLLIDPDIDQLLVGQWKNVFHLCGLLTLCETGVKIVHRHLEIYSTPLYGAPTIPCKFVDKPSTVLLADGRVFVAA